MVNYANPDMVGHTGVWDAAVAALEVVDGCLGRIAAAVLGAGGALVVTADHGNVEQMRDAAGQPHTAHTTADVPIVLIGEPLAAGAAAGRHPGRRGAHPLRAARHSALGPQHDRAQRRILPPA